MIEILYLKTIGIYFILSVFIYSVNCASTVKMTVTVNKDSMTLSCLVSERDSRKNIHLFCPLASSHLHCRENCAKQCHNEICDFDTLIECHDQGFNSDTGVYRIDYVIDGSRSENNGKWSCQYSGTSSSVIFVNASSSKTLPPLNIVPITKQPMATFHNPKLDQRESNQGPSKNRLSPKKSDDSSDETGFQYDKLLTKSEFILTVIGLLALSLICNIFFCGRMIIGHCRSKKKTHNDRQYFSMNPNNPPYNRSNSQASDPDRIYEDTSISQRHMSFLTQIKNSNGNYLAPSTLCPPSGLSTMLPHLAFSQSHPFTNSPSDSGSTQLNHGFPGDHMSSNYASVSFPTENSYTNFHSMQPEMGNASQPVYLAFQSAHPMMTPGSRYVQYSSQPLPQTQTSLTTPKIENRLTSQPMASTSANTAVALPSKSNGTVSTSPDDSKSNYQLSREMMEEADTLLRTADTLLKSTEHEMKYYQ